MASNSSPDVPNGHLQDAVIRLAWAESKIDDLKASTDCFLNETDVALERCRDLDRPDTHQVIQLVGHEPVPDAIRLQFSDICHNIRVALEYLACGLTRANGSIPGRWTGFPFGNDEANFNSLLRSKVSDISSGDRDKIIAIKPYKGGNDLLYSLHELNRTDKHIELVGNAVAFTRLDGTFSVSQEFHMATELIGSLQSGIPILSLPRDAEFKPNIEVTFGICVNNVPTAPQIPLADLCRALCDEVDSLINTFT